MKDLAVTLFFLSFSSTSFGLTFACPPAVEGYAFTSFGLYDEDPIHNYELVPDNFYDPPIKQYWASLEKVELWIGCHYGSYVLDTNHWDAVHFQKIGNRFAKCETRQSTASAGTFDAIYCN